MNQTGQIDADRSRPELLGKNYLFTTPVAVDHSALLLQRSGFEARKVSYCGALRGRYVEI